MADHATSDDPAVQAQLDRFAALSPGRDILGLERISALMSALGNPHRSLPPVFHVAGTNGKGSTCAFLRAAFEAGGKSVHVYTSPHLVRFNERIRLSGKLIEDAVLAPLLAEVLDASEAQNLGPSFFEATTAAALLAFSRTPADACIIEVGLGGRLDATNIIEHPAVCGIASLGIDHESFLLVEEAGTPTDPLTRIGWEKAGIAKSGTSLVIGKYSDEVTQAISDHADKVAAPLFIRNNGWDAAIYDGKIAYRDAHGILKLPLPRMAGVHQVDNAVLAIAMLRHQTAVSIPEAALAAAMEWAYWPARLQKLSAGLLTALLPAGSDVWLDGGHNPDAGAALAAHFSSPVTKLHLIIGMLANKNPAAIIAPLKDKIASIAVVPVPDHAHHDIEAFQEIAHDIPITTAQNVTEAAVKININPAQEVILIAGSLYLAGEVLRLNNQLPD